MNKKLIYGVAIIILIFGGYFLFQVKSEKINNLPILDPNENGSEKNISDVIYGGLSNKTGGLNDELGTTNGNSLNEEDNKIKEFVITAKKFSFTPSTITVNEGDNVRLKITSLDVKHGFYLNEFGISENIPAGKEVIIEFVADKKGTYNFICNVVCGSGHSGMSGILIVE